MADSDFKKRCQDLRRQGLTLGEIQSLLKKPKTSIYFHIQNILLDDRIREKISHTTRTKIVIRNKARRGISRLGRNFNTFKRWTPATVRLVGHLIFDGEIRNRKCIYNNRSQKLIYTFKKLMRPVYAFEPKIYFKKETGVYAVAYFNVALADYLKDKAENLLAVGAKLPLESQREFLRAFFDDEGSVNFKKKQIRGYQHTPEILELVQRLLRNFRIESKIDYAYQEIIISRKENLEKFQIEINFSKGLSVNPKRSNSIWGRPIEKREILNLALQNYRN